jgi:hypothetical protein
MGSSGVEVSRNLDTKPRVRMGWVTRLPHTLRPRTGQGEIMIEAVLVFGFLLALFEFVVLSMVPPRYRLRLLGSKSGCQTVHISMLCLNLWIHWGTLTGTMAATGAFVTSIVTIEIAKLAYGTIVNDRRVRRGIVGFKNEELVL